MDKNDIKKKLRSINWNFDFTIDYSNSIIHPFNCRKYYSYPATFIPEIPFALIEILSQKGDVVLDPFGGIGTTFMQALLLERVPFSYDVNPVASNVCNSLFELFNPKIDYIAVKEQLLKLINSYNESVDYTVLLSERQKELFSWYERTTFNELAFLMIQEEKLSDAFLKSVFNFIISSCLVSLSSQNKGWAYIADNVKPKEGEFRRKQVFKYYTLLVNTLLEDIYDYSLRLGKEFGSFYKQLKEEKRVITGSIFDTCLDDKTVDLIITSPPYPKMIDYVKSQRLAFSYNNMDYNDYVRMEIGARCRRANKDSLNDYIHSIKKINEKLSTLVKEEGYLCIVLPDYDANDDRRQFVEELVEHYSTLGFEKIDEVRRYIPSHKRTLSIQWATLVNEIIYVFRKERDEF